MKTSIALLCTLILIFCLLNLACTRYPQGEAIPVRSDEEIIKGILTDFPKVVANQNYAEMVEAANQLNRSVILLDSFPNDYNLTEAQFAWKKLREKWELSEGFLFGPVETENVDPDIDTWPVNKTDLDSFLISRKEFISSEWLNNQPESIKGFHPLEYLLFGTNGSKKASGLTAIEKEYMLALAGNLLHTITRLDAVWDSSIPNSFGHQFANAGPNSDIFTSKADAFDQMLSALADIAGEVGTGKIGEPFIQQNANLEESPFSQNSIPDFINNIQGINNVYTCTYNSKGTSLSNFTAKYNKGLDNRIKQQIQQSILALKLINLPFGRAIFEQKTQVQTAQQTIESLADMLENELKPLFKQHIKN